jgi:multicomponent Na+:H+ antiporter subunit E
MLLRFTAFLLAFWLLLSGHFEPLMLGLGLASIALTVFLVKRMILIDHESYPFHLSSKLPGYAVYIMKEIIKANIDVIKQIISLKPTSITPQLFEVPTSQETDLARVIYANSITLTPGTVTVELTKEKILIHALTEEAAADLSSGEMAKSIPDEAVEGKE